MKYIFIVLLFFFSLSTFAQVSGDFEGEIKSSTLEGSGNRNVIAGPDGVLKIGSSINGLPSNPSNGDMIYFDGTSWQTIAASPLEEPVLRRCNMVPTWGPCPTGPVCGNGIIEAGESCDDGNTVDGDGCNSCQISGATISSHAAVQITNTTATINWTASENVQGFVEYGTTTSYGQQTNPELSFNYASHGQAISNLQAGTTYYYRINCTTQSGALITASGSFTTTGGGGNMGGCGEVLSFSNLRSQAQYGNPLALEDELVGEYLRRNPCVAFYNVNNANQTISEIADPQPANSTISNLPNPTGGNDTQILASAISSAPAGSVLDGNGKTYRVTNLAINKALRIRNATFIPSGSPDQLLNITSVDVQLFDIDIDVQNVSTVVFAVYVNSNADRFQFVRSSIENMRYTRGGSASSPQGYGTGAAIFIRGIKDTYIAKSVFNSIQSTNAAIRGVWINSGTTDGARIINVNATKVDSGPPLSSPTHDADFLVMQSTNVVNKVKLLGGTYIDAGSRIAKFQSSNGSVHGVTGFWTNSQGDFGTRVRKAFVSLQISSNHTISGNTFTRENADSASFSLAGMISILGKVGQANLMIRNNKFHTNADNYSSAVDMILFTALSPPQTNTVFRDNVITGTGQVDAIYRLHTGWSASSLTIANNSVDLDFINLLLDSE